MSGLKNTYVQNLWTLGLAIAAFSVGQSVYFAFQTANSEFASKAGHGWLVILAFTWPTTLAYAIAIWHLDRLQVSLIDPPETHVLDIIKRVRTLKLIAVVFGAVLVSGLAILFHVSPPTP